MPFRVRNVPVTDSTNDDAAALLGALSEAAGADTTVQTVASGRDRIPSRAMPAEAGVVIVADYQRAGRGRHARAWVAPAGSSLLFTAILPRAVPSAHLWATTFWTALGVADGIESSTGLRVGLQWPNDLLLDGRKCSGILCVSRVSGGEAWVGCGVGLNVRRPPSHPELDAIEPAPAFLSDFAPRAIADRDASAGPDRASGDEPRRPSGVADRPAILRSILDAFERRLPELDDPLGIARAWERRAELEGTPYRLLIDGETHPRDATARRIGADGALIVRDGARERAVALADARVLRSAARRDVESQ